MNYNYESKYKEYEGNPREYRVPINASINNTEYKQQQLRFIRNLYPKGLNKQIEVN